MKTYVFIDASNIIYGTRNEKWKVDFKKLFKYLSERYSAEKIYYFAGIEENNLKQKKFYTLLKKIGYTLVLKNVKLYKQTNGVIVRKANCDVDLTFYAMKYINEYSRCIFFTGDGDFLILLEYLIKSKKEVILISNGSRTAKELKLLLKGKFTELKSLKTIIEYK